MTPVRIAVMGAGQIGRRHISHIVAEPTVALHAVVDPAPGTQAVAAASGAPWFPDFDTMLAAGRPDGVLIATPNQLHVAHGLAAVAAGLPVLVEKPIADDLGEGAKLVSAAASAGVPLLTGHHRRHNPMVARAKEIIASGKLGRIVAAHSFFWLLKPDEYFETEWRRMPGAGPVLMNAIHDIDLFRYLVGEVAEVHAFQNNAVRGHPVDETSVVILRFDNGALGTLNISDTVVAPWSWEQTTGENAAFPQADQHCYHIGGTHGSLAVPRLELWSNPGKRGWFEPFAIAREVVADEDPLRLQIRHFARVIRGDELPLVSGAEGLATLKVIAAIHRSAREGRSVRP
ncbi:MAG: Gfo/Idh/MocA family protein [Beijerinckiaceae bacterium]